uniref:Uncharacterized protein n=1 Tax=Mus spicilegus TaxID=10103 RepID=A0A8C6IJR7_MUSSI
ISASDTPKCRFDRSSFPPVSMWFPALKLPTKWSCCPLSGSCFGLRYGGSLFLPLWVMAGLYLLSPVARFTRESGLLWRPCWILFSLMMSSKDRPILSAMAGVDLVPENLVRKTKKFELNQYIPTKV